MYLKNTHHSLSSWTKLNKYIYIHTLVFTPIHIRKICTLIQYTKYNLIYIFDLKYNVKLPFVVNTKVGWSNRNGIQNKKKLNTYTKVLYVENKQTINFTQTDVKYKMSNTFDFSLKVHTYWASKMWNINLYMKLNCNINCTHVYVYYMCI